MMSRLSNIEFVVRPRANGQRAQPVAARMAICLILLSVSLLPIGCGRETAPSDAVEPSGEEVDPSPEEGMLSSVDLGTFRIRESRPLENQKIDLQFVVKAAVSGENKPKLEKIAESRLHTLRDQIIIAIRTAESTEFDEPDLKRIRRRMMLRIASVLDEPIIEDIYLTDFRMLVD